MTKHLFIFLFSLLSGGGLVAGGGYLGKRVILGAEMGYSPRYYSLTGALTSFDMVYGANAGVIVGRYSQLNFSYMLYSLGKHSKYDSDLSDNSKINGFQAGVHWRQFRKKKGGLAPIGKFIDMGLDYESAEYNVQRNSNVIAVPILLERQCINGTIALGTQGVFWNRIVANTGLRFSAPLVVLKEEATYYNGDLDYMSGRMLERGMFTVFFGAAVLL